MNQTQLVCQHCGSTLNFGTEIAPGTMVNCLICMRTFAAANPVAAPLASASPPSPKPKSAPPSTKAPATSKAVKPVIPPIPAPVPAAGNNSTLMAALGGLLVLLTVGIGIAAWKMTGSGIKNLPPSTDGPIASAKDNTKKTDLAKDAASTDGNKKVTDGKPGLGVDGKPKNDADSKNGTSDVVKPATDKKDKAIEDDPDDDRDKKKKKGEEPKLIRKDPVKPPPTKDPEPDPIKKIEDPRPAPPAVKLVGVDQNQINTAIDRGVAYLKKNQQPDGTWSMRDHPTGYAALGGLTLLESGAAADDQAVQNAAKYVRSNVTDIEHTYELSLAVLFLDRLGDPRDRPMIQGISLRILAGQLPTGAWKYECPKLTAQEMYQLFNFLHGMKTPNLLNPQGRITKLGLNPVNGSGKSSDLFQQFNDLIVTQGIPGAAAEQKEFDPNDPKKEKGKPVKHAVAIRYQELAPGLKQLPVTMLQGRRKGEIPMPGGTDLLLGGGDNSNTQFALLALWAARRHDVPADYAVLYSYKRFVGTQAFDGGWPYAGIGGSRNTMTCVGLLSLALGHGVAPEYLKFDAKNPKNTLVKPAVQEANIKRALVSLARSIGAPDPNPSNVLGAVRPENLYLLWSIERVAMLYDLKAIEGKDWYSWGAQILVYNQGPEGAWLIGDYTGSTPPVNTCLALLFLRRSNLVHDLTNDLRLFAPIQSPK